MIPAFGLLLTVGTVASILFGVSWGMAQQRRDDPQKRKRDQPLSANIAGYMVMAIGLLLLALVMVRLRMPIFIFVFPAGSLLFSLFGRRRADALSNADDDYTEYESKSKRQGQHAPYEYYQLGDDGELHPIDPYLNEDEPQTKHYDHDRS